MASVTGYEGGLHRSSEADRQLGSKVRCRDPRWREEEARLPVLGRPGLARDAAVSVRRAMSHNEQVRDPSTVRRAENAGVRATRDWLPLLMFYALCAVGASLLLTPLTDRVFPQPRLPLSDPAEDRPILCRVYLLAGGRQDN
jgi:hypothetical protein